MEVAVIISACASADKRYRRALSSSAIVIGVEIGYHGETPQFGVQCGISAQPLAY
jgi:hypothetical protein